jgi:hypothetical protein
VIGKEAADALQDRSVIVQILSSAHRHSVTLLNDRYDAKAESAVKH